MSALQKGAYNLRCREERRRFTVIYNEQPERMPRCQGTWWKTAPTLLLGDFIVTFLGLATMQHLKVTIEVATQQKCAALESQICVSEAQLVLHDLRLLSSFSSSEHLEGCCNSPPVDYPDC